jgi:hypothetical protein
LSWEVQPPGASLRGFDVYHVSGSGAARHVAALGPSDLGWTVPPEVRGGTFRVSAISSTGLVTAAEEVANPVSGASCAPAPRQDCFEAAKALILAKEDKQGKELLKVSLLKIEGDIPTSTFGDLPTEEGQVSLCIYGDNGDLVQEYVIDRGGEFCGRRPCWLPKSTKGFSFSDKAGESSGINKVNLFGGSGGKAKVTLRGKNNARKDLFNLPLVTAELEASTSPSVQLSFDTGACIGATGLSGKVKRSGFYVAKK